MHFCCSNWRDDITTSLVIFDDSTTHARDVLACLIRTIVGVKCLQNSDQTGYSEAIVDYNEATIIADLGDRGEDSTVGVWIDTQW